MLFKSLISMTAAFFTLLMMNSASAVTVNWVALGLDENSILSGGGQTITDFSGITGLNAVVTGSSNLRDPGAGFTHPTTLDLKLRTELVPGDTDPVSITFSFNQYVTFKAGMHYFGDGGVQEEFRWSSNTGIFDATVAGDNQVFNDLTSLVSITSGSNSASELAQITTASVKDVTIALGGFNFTGRAGSTVSMDIETTVVPIPAAVWLFASGLLGLVGIARRKARV